MGRKWRSRAVPRAVRDVVNETTASPEGRSFLSLGSNRGDRLGYLVSALQALQVLPDIKVVTLSGIYETEPVGKSDQPWFLNLVVEIGTSLDPESLLYRVQRIERDLGRRRQERWGARTIDVDILCMALFPAWQAARLTLPHPRLAERLFVLIPFAEIAADFHITAWDVPVQQLLKRCPDRHAVRLFLSAPKLWQRMREVPS